MVWLNLKAAKFSSWWYVCCPVFLCSSRGVLHTARSYTIVAFALSDYLSVPSSTQFLFALPCHHLLFNLLGSWFMFSSFTQAMPTPPLWQVLYLWRCMCGSNCRRKFHIPKPEMISKAPLEIGYQQRDVFSSVGMVFKDQICPFSTPINLSSWSMRLVSSTCWELTVGQPNSLISALSISEVTRIFWN